MVEQSPDRIPGRCTSVTNEDVWNAFWKEVCVYQWGNEKASYFPSPGLKKIMNKYEIKLKENDIPNERVY